MRNEFNTAREILEDTISESPDKALKKKADKTGMPFGILKQVFQRGVKAWQSGHRPGTNAVQWGHARVNSFVTKSKGTWGGADKDLAAKVQGKKEEVNEVTDKEINAVKKLSKDIEKVKKNYFKIAKMGDKTLKNTSFNKKYESILKAQQEILSLIGELSNQKMMQGEEVEVFKNMPVIIEDYKAVMGMFNDGNWKKIVKKHKKAIDDFRNEKRQKDLPWEVETKLVAWAIDNGEVRREDDVEDFIQAILDEGFKSDAQRRAAFASGYKAKGKKGKKDKKEEIIDNVLDIWYKAGLQEKKEFNPKVIDKIAKLTDRNDHNESILTLAKELKDREAIKLMNSIKGMHKVYGHMPRELIDLRNKIFDNLMRQSSSKYSNHKDVYNAL
tara:strand:+ start:12906 stop:14060 length:1155 start_codon:yes stop_codon:yes gene_type:complete